MRTALVAALTVVLLIPLSSCSVERSRAATFAPVTGGFEQQAFARINRYRVSKGLRPLVWSDVIADQARRHSQNMARGRTRYGHGGFKQRLKVIAQRIDWSRAAENVVANPTAAGAVDSWLKSRSHRKDIEGNFDLTGVGAARARNGSVYFTQIFVGSD